MSTTLTYEDSVSTASFKDRVDAMRCCDTAEVRRRVEHARREEARWRLEALAGTRVLDEREQLTRVPDAKLSARTAKVNVEVARELESLPRIAAAVEAGEISLDQLEPLVQVATPDTDAEWAHRAPNVAPIDLHRMARRTQQVTLSDALARRAARSVFTWREPAEGMGAGRWRLPDVDGVFVDNVLTHMAEQMRPPAGEPWAPLTQRKADAFIELFRRGAEAAPATKAFVEIVNIHQPDGTTAPEVEGIPVAVETLTGYAPTATARDVESDAVRGTRSISRRRPALPKDVVRHVKRRDLHCRVPGCHAPAREIHHLNPRVTHGDTDDVHVLAGVCPPHHRLLVPNGPYWLMGDAEEADGLRLVHRDDLIESARDGPSP